MNEIEFRAWDEQNKIMHFDFEFIRSGIESKDWIVFKSDKQRLDDKNAIFHPLQNPYFQQQLKIMQFTGLKDKAGKKIYVGDIIKYSGDTKIRIFDPIQEKIKSPYWSITYVIYEAPSFKEIMIKQENDFFGELPHKQPFNLFAIPICEIIGNIWENPKLLEG